MAPARSSAMSVPLPAHWPRTVKSAVVQAAGLAHMIITQVRGWCANSPLERVRLKGEDQRLRTEVALLQKELAIKDARLAAIPPRERPHYPPVQRLQILTLKADRAWNQAQTAARFLVSDATIARCAFRPPSP